MYTYMSYTVNKIYAVTFYFVTLADIIRFKWFWHVYAPNASSHQLIVKIRARRTLRKNNNVIQDHSQQLAELPSKQTTEFMYSIGFE